MPSAADRRARVVQLLRAATTLCAAAAAAAASAGTSSHARDENAPVICHERRVEIIVGGVEASDLRACSGAGIDTERGVASRRPATGEARIAPAVQQARDDDRRAILQQELNHAEGELAQERSRPDGDPRAIARKKEDVAALRRELQTLPALVR